MKFGAVAIFDALGFKGIWRRGLSHETVIAKLRSVEKAAFEAKHGSTMILDGAGLSFAVAALSDTVVIGVSAPDDAELTKVRAVGGAALATAFVVQAAAMTQPALAYRGCIAVGNFEMDDRFIVGEAVDDAAEHMDAAEAAIVWCTPSAAPFSHLPGKEGLFLFPHRVPLKGGHGFDTYAVNPFVPSGSVDALKSAILATFKSERIDVCIKRQNTERFLDAALADLARTGHLGTAPST